MLSDVGQPLRLNLGCGNDVRPGYVNHDVIRHRDEVDVVHDLRQLPWPWFDDSAAEILALDLLEHLPDVVPVIDECWRILQPGGVLHVSVPHYGHETAWLDPTHRRAFHVDSFDYFDPDTDWGRKYGYYTPRKWKIEHKELCDGNVIAVMRPRKGNPVHLQTWLERERYPSWNRRVARALDEIASAVPAGDTFILVDQDEWETSERVAGRRRIPFLERNGVYWGSPSDDTAAIREVERLRQEGASFIAIGWPAFWWLEHYAGWHQYLRSRHRCAVETDRVVIFDLRGSRPALGEHDGTRAAVPALAESIVAAASSERQRWRRIGNLRGFAAQVFSQNGEDGILAELLRRVGRETEFFVEVGAGDGIECNCGRLVVEEHWRGVFIEGDPEQARRLAEHYRHQVGLRCVHAWVTSSNIEELLAANDAPLTFDVLSIDIDGNDYWVWSAIRGWQPRIVVIEHNASHPPGTNWVMREDPDHRWDGTDHFGAKPDRPRYARRPEGLCPGRHRLEGRERLLCAGRPRYLRQVSGPKGALPLFPAAVPTGGIVTGAKL